MARILVVDNYDSFVYNLVQYLAQIGAEVEVWRNDDPRFEAPDWTAGFDGILLSPGPGTPEDAGVSMKAIGHFAGKIPILGVCLGHQAIGQHFGGKVVRGPEPVHGKPVTIRHDGRTLFDGIPQDFNAGRYHSLVVDRETVPDELEISAESPDGLVMALRHKGLPIEGVEFYPESILTEHGKKLLQNFMSV